MAERVRKVHRRGWSQVGFTTHPRPRGYHLEGFTVMHDITWHDGKGRFQIVGSLSDRHAAEAACADLNRRARGRG